MYRGLASHKFTPIPGVYHCGVSHAEKRVAQAERPMLQ